MNVENKNKVIWRQDLIDMCRSFHNCENKESPLPLNKQWFTLGGPIVGDNGIMKPLSEYPHLISNGLQPHQFISIENDIITHNLNSTIIGPKWLYGSLLFVIASESNNRKTFNPGFLNLDLYSMALRGGLFQLSQITDILTGLNVKDIMIAANFVLKYRHEDDYRKIPDILIKHTNFGSIRHLWNIEGMMTYRNRNTTMGTIILYR